MIKEICLLDKLSLLEQDEIDMHEFSDLDDAGGILSCIFQ